MWFRREEVVRRLSNELCEGTWRPRGYELLFLRDPKPRVIARAPVEDRVVHTALVKAMEPVLARSLLPACTACRPGHGTHRAVLRLLRGMRRHAYVLHLDVRAYFPSIDRDIVMALLRRRIRDRRFLRMVQHVLDGARGLYADPVARAHAGLGHAWPPADRGLPVGAYTSQVFAAWLYLDALDHRIVRVLHAPDYTRYVDDFFLFGRSRRQLRAWRDELVRWLAEERGLRLKRPDAPPRSTSLPLDALGHRVTRDGLTALPRVDRRLRGKVRAAAHGAGRVDLARSLASTAGVIGFGAEIVPHAARERRVAASDDRQGHGDAAG